ncbi:MAG: ankyrin repeat domain-containing protein [Puniceicoccales bacterium]|nr:ankyrin repeat domain-containing protein [Puniceicoccales bacterium]
MSRAEKERLHVVIGTTSGDLTNIEHLIELFVNKQANMSNARVLLGYAFPIVFFATCLKDAEALRRLLIDESLVIKEANGNPITIDRGNTLMHTAAMNSASCTQLLVEDGRVDVNRRNDDGETPLYVAMKYNHDDAVKALLSAKKIRINSRDVMGRTMLHKAVIDSNVNVVKQILALVGNTYGEDGGSLDANLMDDLGHVPGYYISSIRDTEIANAIRELFSNAGAYFSP